MTSGRRCPKARPRPSVSTVGDTIELESRVGAGTPVRVVVTGIWRPDRTDPYWLESPLDLDGTRTTGRFTTRGPFVVGRDALLGLESGRAVAMEWRAIPALDRLATDQVGELRERIDSLAGRASAAIGGSPPRVTTVLPATLGEVERSILVSHSGITLLTIQFAVLAGYAIVLVAGMLLERRRTDLALMRSRGASTVHLAFMALTESAILAALAAIAAVPLAALVVYILGSVGPLADSGIGNAVTVTSTVVQVTVVAAIVSAVTLTVPTLLSALNPANVRAAAGRPSGRSAAQRLGLDLVLVVVAIIAFWQLRIYGAPITTNARGTLGVDPLLVAAPAIGLAGRGAARDPDRAAPGPAGRATPGAPPRARPAVDRPADRTAAAALHADGPPADARRLARHVRDVVCGHLDPFAG